MAKSQFTKHPLVCTLFMTIFCGRIKNSIIPELEKLYMKPQNSHCFLLLFKKLNSQETITSYHLTHIRLNAIFSWSLVINFGKPHLFCSSDIKIHPRFYCDRGDKIFALTRYRIHWVLMAQLYYKNLRHTYLENSAFHWKYIWQEKERSKLQTLKLCISNMHKTLFSNSMTQFSSHSWPSKHDSRKQHLPNVAELFSGLFFFR